MAIANFVKSHLARTTSTGRVVVREIEGLRFIAIAMVVLFHLAAYVQYYSPVRFTPPHEGDLAFRLLMLGDRGVPLFFIISGFVLALPFALHHVRGAQPVRLRSYFLRRLTRLEPPYVAALLLLYVLLVVVKGESALGLLGNLIASAFYVHNQVYDQPSLIDSVAWSLEVEVQFYVLAPLLCRMFALARPLHRRAAIIAVALVALALQVAFSPVSNRFNLSVLNYLQYFLTGFLLCDLYVTDWRAQLPTTAPAWDLVTLVGWPLLYWLTLTDAVPERFAFPVLALPLFIAVFRGPLTRRLLTSGAPVLIGGMCYSIYLLHYQVISFVGRFSVPWIRGGSFGPNYLVQALVVVPVVLLVCGVFYALVERPCMDRDWPSKLRAWSTRVIGAPRRA